ncbi:hypothetical protein [Candidatus Phytoplasma sacchari]
MSEEPIPSLEKKENKIMNNQAYLFSMRFILRSSFTCFFNVFN